MTPRVADTSALLSTSPIPKKHIADYRRAAPRILHGRIYPAGGVRGWFIGSALVWRSVCDRLRVVKVIGV